MVNNVFKTVTAVEPQEDIANVVYLIVCILAFSTQDKAIILVLSLLEMKNQVKNVKGTIFSILKEFPMSNELFKLEKYINYRIKRYFFSFLVNGVTF